MYMLWHPKRSKILALTLLSLVLWIQADQNEGREPTILQLVAMISEEPNQTRTTQDWERGLEILPGARVAVQEVNRNTDVLPGYQLELVEIITEGCSGKLALVQLIQHLTTNTEKEDEKERQTVGIIGPLCTEAAELVATVAGHPGISLVQIAATQSTTFEDRTRNPHLFQMLPLSQAYIAAVLGLMQEFSWDKLAVICILDQDPYHCRTANAFVNKAIRSGAQVLYFGEVFTTGSSRKIIFGFLSDLRQSGAKVILAFLDPLIASELMCAAYQKNLSFPDYAWMLPGVKLEDFKNTTGCEHSPANGVEGVLLLDALASNSGDASCSNDTQQEKQGNTLWSNTYASVFYDSVWALAMALDSNHANLALRLDKTELAESIIISLRNVSFNGSTGFIEFDNRQNREHVAIGVNRIISGEAIPVAHYNPFSRSVTVNWTAIGHVPDDEIDVVYEKHSLHIAIILALVVATCFVFTTLMLTLYVCYRNQPEVKATSPPVSVFIFIGCYFVLLNDTAIHIVGTFVITTSASRIATCQIVTYFSGIGYTLTSATLLFRTLRVYRVFTYFGRTGKLCSNYTLAFMIICTTLVTVLLASIWAAADHIRVVDLLTYHPEGRPPYFEANQYCYSQHYVAWTSVYLGYVVLLLVVLSILACMTRKVHRSDFKDTKKLNLFLGTILFVSTVALLTVINVYNDPKVVESVFIVSDLTLVFSVQSFFVLPKIAPPILRHLHENNTCGMQRLLHKYVTM